MKTTIFWPLINQRVVSVPAPHIPDFKTLQGQIRTWAVEEGKPYKPYF